MDVIDPYQLEKPKSVVCVECGCLGELVVLLKTGSDFDGLECDTEVGEPAWKPAKDGWYCPDCAEQAKSDIARYGEKVTVPEPPDEWRFCQECGEQLDPRRVEGQYCEECIH